MLTVLLGGARSGKSTAALRLVVGHDDVCFIATSPRIQGDDDLSERIAHHRAERPSSWTTIEAELDLAAAIDGAGDVPVIVDCLTVWLGNLMHHQADAHEIDAASTAALTAASRRAAPTIVVTNEVGLGIVPADATTRRYRDDLGRINQRWVAAADRALFMVAGRALDLTAVTEP